MSFSKEVLIPCSHRNSNPSSTFTLEDEKDKKVSKKWKNVKGGLAEFCGVKSIRK